MRTTLVEQLLTAESLLLRTREHAVQAHLQGLADDIELARDHVAQLAILANDDLQVIEAEADLDWRHPQLPF